MNAWGDDVGATAILSIGVMAVCIIILLLTMAVGAILKKLTGRHNPITRWMAR